MGKPLLLLVRDGWGMGPDYEGNAVRAADTPNVDSLLAEHPNCVLEASGLAVGVREGSQGSSEVGHLNMGAGRVVQQEIVRVDKMICNGQLFEIPRLLEAVEHCKSTGAKFHLMGLVQDQGVHATQEHLFAMLKFLSCQGVEKVCIHFFTDGRDTPPQSALTYLDELEEVMARYRIGQIASITGRYWAMDRAESWDRTERAYRAMVFGEGLHAPSAREAIENAYERARSQRMESDDGLVETDEFIRPTVVVDRQDKPTGLIEPGDAVLHLNYRQDRAIQLTKAIVDDTFSHFDRGQKLDIRYMGLTRYYDDFPFALVPPMNMTDLLGQVLSRAGLSQLRIAELQKYRHVTSFFNGKLLKPDPGEDRIEVESLTIPEDQRPEMRAYEVTDLVLCAVTEGIGAVRARANEAELAGLTAEPFEAENADSLKDTYDVMVLNLANGDMVGHTGSFPATKRAIEVVDECVGKVVRAVLERDGTVLVTADHGNAEEMTEAGDGATVTAHSINPVEFILVANDSSRYALVKKGKLADIAVTMLDLLGLKVPRQMTARSLIAKKTDQ